MARASRLADKLAVPLIYTRENFGTDPESIAAYRAAERLAGGPAPMREENASK